MAKSITFWAIQGALVAFVLHTMFGEGPPNMLWVCIGLAARAVFGHLRYSAGKQTQ